jgi:hypothetical protein
MTDPRHAYHRSAQRFPVSEYRDGGLVQSSLFTVWWSFCRGIGWQLARAIFRRGR